jgi:hypothetical protein
MFVYDGSGAMIVLGAFAERTLRTDNSACSAALR